MNSEPFTRDEVRERHRAKIRQILYQHEDLEDGIDALVNYVMSRIGTVISYERRKYERRLKAVKGSNNNGGTRKQRQY